MKTKHITATKSVLYEVAHIKDVLWTIDDTYESEDDIPDSAIIEYILLNGPSDLTEMGDDLMTLTDENGEEI